MESNNGFSAEGKSDAYTLRPTVIGKRDYEVQHLISDAELTSLCEGGRHTTFLRVCSALAGLLIPIATYYVVQWQWPFCHERQQLVGLQAQDITYALLAVAGLIGMTALLWLSDGRERLAAEIRARIKTP